MLVTKVLTNSLSDTKGASQALTHHPWLIISHALSSGLLKHLGSIKLLLELKLFFCITCSGPVWASRPGNSDLVLNVHETYLPCHYHLICPPEAYQPPSLGQLLLICPQKVCLTPSSGSHTCPCSSLACVPAALWHIGHVSWAFLTFCGCIFCGIGCHLWWQWGYCPLRQSSILLLFLQQKSHSSWFGRSLGSLSVQRT